MTFTLLLIILLGGGGTDGVNRDATLCGDRACRVRGMQGKLRCWVSLGDPLRRSCVPSARKAGEIAFLAVGRQPFAEIARVECAKSRRN